MMLLHPDFVRGGPWVVSRLTKADWAEVRKVNDCHSFDALKMVAAREVSARHGYSLLANHLDGAKFGSRNANYPEQLAEFRPWPSSLLRPLPVKRSGARTSGTRTSGWKAYRGDAQPGSSLWPSGKDDWQSFNRSRTQANARAKAKAQSKTKAKASGSNKNRAHFWLSSPNTGNLSSSPHLIISPSPQIILSSSPHLMPLTI